MGSISPASPFRFSWATESCQPYRFAVRVLPITLLTVTKTGEKATLEGHRDYKFLNHLYFMKYKKAPKKDQMLQLIQQSSKMKKKLPAETDYFLELEEKLKENK